MILAANLCLVLATTWGHLWNNSLIERGELGDHLEELCDGIDELERTSSNMFINALHPDQQSDQSRMYRGYIQEQEKQFERISKVVNTLNNSYGEKTSGLLNDFQKSKPVFRDLIESEINLIERISSDNMDASLLDSSIQDLHMKFIDFSTALRNIDNKEAILSEENSSYILHSFTTAKTTLIIIMIIALPASILFGIVIIGLIVKPLTELEEGMKAIVDGHGSITNILPETTGEAGRLTEQYNKLNIIIQASLLQIAEVGSKIKSSSTQLKTNAELTQLGLTGQNEEVEDIINRMKSMGENISIIDNSTSTTATAAEDTYSKCQSSSQLMQETSHTVHKLDSESIETINKMDRMASSVDSIGVVIDVINDIAAQTNLLSLNAAIEAARAGESGRGFAVVADEVRNLAVRTQESTEEIGVIINELKANTQKSQDAINNNREHAGLALQKVEEISEVFKEIDSSSHEIAQMTQQVSESLTQQVEMAEDINRHTINLKTTTKQADASARTMEILGNKLEQLTNQITFAIERFNINDDVTEIMALTNAMEDLSDADITEKAVINPEDSNSIELF